MGDGVSGRLQGGNSFMIILAEYAVVPSRERYFMFFLLGDYLLLQGRLSERNSDML